jgi:hypothetical protein
MSTSKGADTSPLCSARALDRTDATQLETGGGERHKEREKKSYAMADEWRPSTRANVGKGKPEKDNFGHDKL